MFSLYAVASKIQHQKEIAKNPLKLLRRILSGRIPYRKLFSLRSRNMQNSQIPENWNRNDGGGASIRPGSFLEVSVTDSDAGLSMKIAETEFFLLTTGRGAW